MVLEVVVWISVDVQLTDSHNGDHDQLSILQNFL